MSDRREVNLCEHCHKPRQTFDHEGLQLCGDCLEYQIELDQKLKEHDEWQEKEDEHAIEVERELMISKYTESHTNKCEKCGSDENVIEHNGRWLCEECLLEENPSIDDWIEKNKPDELI